MDSSFFFDKIASETDEWAFSSDTDDLVNTGLGLGNSYALILRHEERLISKFQ